MAWSPESWQPLEISVASGANHDVQCRLRNTEAPAVGVQNHMIHMQIH